MTIVVRLASFSVRSCSSAARSRATSSPSPSACMRLSSSWLTRPIRSRCRFAATPLQVLALSPQHQRLVETRLRLARCDEAGPGERVEAFDVLLGQRLARRVDVGLPRELRDFRVDRRDAFARRLDARPVTLGAQSAARVRASRAAHRAACRSAPASRRDDDLRSADSTNSTAVRGGHAALRSLARRRSRPAAGAVSRNTPPIGSSDPGTVARFVYEPKDANAAIDATTASATSAATVEPIRCASRIEPSQCVDRASSASRRKSDTGLIVGRRDDTAAG